MGKKGEKISPFDTGLKRAVHARSPRNLTELGQYCKEQCSEIVSRCASLIETYPHRFSAVIAAKCLSTKYWLEGGEYLCNHLFYITYFYLIDITV